MGSPGIANPGPGIIGAGVALRSERLIAAGQAKKNRSQRASVPFYGETSAVIS